MAGAQRISFVPQILLGLIVSASLYIGFTLPPRAARLSAPAPDPLVVSGAYHVHTRRSDGTGSVDDVAQAAARAGLQFVILTDHGDATRTPDRPRYNDGVLVIDAVEISTTAGHLVALGLDAPAPYPLAGEARDVIEDVHRLGGWVVIAHPDSPKPDLRWRSWNVPYDGIEWINVDSERRDESLAHLAGSALRYLLRPPETVASLFQRPVLTLRRWDAAGRTAAVTGLAALDAHAGLVWQTERNAPQGTPHSGVLAMPGYRQMFRAVRQAVVLERAFSGDAGQDAASLLSSLRAGRTYSVVTGLAAPGQLSFTASGPGGVIPMGALAGPVGSPVTFHARVNDNTARVVLLHNGTPVASSNRGQIDFDTSVTAGPYRVEVYQARVSMPWIVSNPIYGGAAFNRPVNAEPPRALRLVRLPAVGNWSIEHAPTSEGAVAADAGATRFTFTLGPGQPSNQFAALSTALDAASAAEGFDRVQFTVRADRPMRFSVQLRLGSGQRWRHSVYAESAPHPVVLYLQDFQPAESTTSQRPIVARIRSVLFVVDTLNAGPSTRGTLWLSDVALGVGQTER